MSRMILREDHGAVTVLTLNRPDKLNALSPALFADLREELERIEVDAAVRCVILKGAGRSFCAGADIDLLNAGFVTEDPDFRSKTVEYLGNIRPILIAAVHNHCYTGGLELALAADVIVAAGNARFRDTHAQLGIVPRWGLSVRLPRRVGIAAARRISMTCEIVTADEALRIGLCDYVVEPGDLDSFALDLAQRAAASDPAAVAGLRRLYEAGSAMALADALVFERGFSSTPPARAS